MLNNSPPRADEKHLYVDAGRFRYYSVGIISFVLLVSGMGLFAIQRPHTYWYFFYLLVIVAYLTISYVVGIFGENFDLADHENTIASFRGEPSVDVFLPSAGEPLEIIENTFEAVSKLDYPNHKVFVLDDSDRQGVRDLAYFHGFQYIVRPNRGWMKKSGNVRNAFAITKGEFILILDADFCPRPEMLKEMLPYMMNEKNAIVQSPQYFSIDEGHTDIQKGAGFVQELFYRLIQVNRNTYKASICVGTCALYRRKALEPYGGTALIEYSEDLHTGFNCLELGYDIQYIPVILSKGICPDTLKSYFTQQYRWSMGSLSLMISKRFWVTKLGVMRRLSYLSGMGYYIATALGIVFTPIPALVMTWVYPDQVAWYNLTFSIPSFIFGTFWVAKWSKLRWGLYSLTARQAAYYAHLFAIRDMIFGNLMEWVPTGAKTGKNSRFLQLKNALFWWTSVCTFAIVAGSFYHMTSVRDNRFYLVMLFAFFNYFVSFSILKDAAE